MHNIRSIKTTCPHCGHVCGYMVESTDSHRRPMDGDIMLCSTCESWSIYAIGGPGNLRLPTGEETAGINGNPQATLAVRAMRERKGRDENVPLH